MNAASQIGILPYIFIAAVITFGLRLVPFVLFMDEKAVPPVIRYIGKYLPPAIIAGIVVYCLKIIDLSVFPYGAKEFIALAAVVGLHLWKRNTLLSVFASTALYMLLVQGFLGF